MASEYISLEVLAATLGLPPRYLRSMAIRGEIPHLNVNGRRRFNEDQVRAALERIAERTDERKEATPT